MLIFTICTKPNQKLHGVRYWNEIFRVNKNYTVLRVRENKKLLGQVAIDFVEDEAWIYFLAVNPRKRGNGIGTRLMKKVEKFIKRSGTKYIFLRPQKDFEAKLVPWYEELGYERLYRDESCRNEWLMLKVLK